MTTHDLVVPTDSAADVAGTGPSPEPHGTGPVATPEPDGSPSATETDAGGADRLPAAPASTPPLGHAPTCPVPCCTSPDDPAVTGRPEPYTPEAFDDLLATVWADLDSDRHRFDDLLADALGFIGGIAMHRGLGGVSDRAIEHLRATEQRALWGPNHEQEDHR